ncbi:DUF3817 domain-containing protein [Spongiactinospora gelatinilytica]|uniref:DUF3817 domain-containing protein n=1 Tax=Spongiactinospora gelatinilytica TaxID=2666298 RepID=UPI0018F6CB24|nr:DUF3817 domain-containing protein [Spongiactinospora gelatinilytica]
MSGLPVLRFASAVEAISLVVLLVNLVTLHARPVSAVVGPLHGAAYLVVIMITLLARAPIVPGVRLRALIPGIGGLLAVRRLKRGETPGQ